MRGKLSENGFMFDSLPHHAENRLQGLKDALAIIAMEGNANAQSETHFQLGQGASVCWTF